jgi:hypothetical protein
LIELFGHAQVRIDGVAEAFLMSNHTRLETITSKGRRSDAPSSNSGFARMT